MEIFQTIWTTLSTPNEGLIQILSIPLTFIEMTVIMLLFSSLLNISATKKQKIIYILLTSLWTIVSNAFINKEYTVFINLLILPLSVLIIFKTSVLKSILALIIPSVIMALLDAFIAKICLLIFSFSMEQALIVPIYRIAIALSIYFIFYIIYILSNKFQFTLNLLDSMNKKNKSMLICIFILGSISIVIQFYLIGYYNESLPVFITFLSLISLLAYFFTSMYSLTKTNELQITEQDL